MPHAHQESLDLENLNNKVLLFGGTYSNLQATKAMKKQALLLGIPAENDICTDDLIAYCGNPEETVNFVRDWGCHVVMGNCEQSVGFELDDCGCSFNE